MTTLSRKRITVELDPEDKIRLQKMALSLGYIQSTGPDAGEVGSISALMRAIAKGEKLAVVKGDFLPFA